MKQMNLYYLGEGGINSTLTVTCTDEFIGETLTCTNGTKSITKTVPLSMNVVFDLSSAGTWVLSNSLTPETSSYIVENIEYNKILSNIPDGKTVTPTDDIQIWLHCADIWDKNYTILAEVLADNDTLLALITSDNAVDYMVRSTTWAAAQALVPTMTSDTTPSGQVIYSSTYPLEGDIPYHCFDNNTSTNGCSALISSNTSTTWWVGYTFTSPTVINRAKITSLTMTRGSISTPIKIQGSNDAFSSDVHDLYSFDSVVSNADVYFNNDTEYTSYRLLVTANADSQSGEHYVKFAELQFYSASITDSSTAMQYISSYDYAANTLLSDSTWCNAICNSEYSELILNTKVPVMTSNTTPSGVVSADLTSEGYPYYLFDNNSNTRWYAQGTLVSGWDTHGVQYDFGYPVKVGKISLTHGPSSASTSTHKASIYGSNDGSTFTKIVDFPEYEAAGESTKQTFTEIVATVAAYRYLRCYSVRTNPVHPASPTAYIYTLQYYSRKTGGVQTWLHSANITDKSYTTLSQVLADSTTLSALMSNSDAVDYLVTAVGWANDVCANSNAMTYIGQNNYAANTLLADSDWCEAICNSEYLESVLNVKVPTMTSNTTPSGTVSASAANESYKAFFAFDGSTSSAWSAYSGSSTQWIQYAFTSPVAVTLFRNIAGGGVYSFNIKGSNDGSTWSDNLVTGSNPAWGDYRYPFVNSTAYKYYRLTCTVSSGVPYIHELQFYGREDV